jgi:hypothetical protein
MARLIRLAALWGVLVFLCRCWLMLRLRYQLEYGEGHMLGLAYYLSKGQPIYTPGANPPYVYGAHLPLYLWLVGLGLGDTPSFFPARLISVIASLVTVGASAAWLKQKQGWTSACAGVSFLLIHPLLLGWGALARVDNLGLCFSVLALLLARPLPSAGLCLLALMSKQSFVAAPLALALSQKPKAGGLFLIGYAVTAVLVFVGLNLSFFSGNLPILVHSVSDWPSAWMLWVTYLPSIAVLAGLACLAPGSLPGVGRLRWYALASVLPVAAAVKQGSYYNYFLELHWALSMLAALALSRQKLLPLALLQLLIGLFTQFPILKSPLDHWRRDTLPCLSGTEPAWFTRMRANDALESFLQQHPGPVLAEQCGNPLLFGREPIVCDCFALFHDLAGSGAWDPTPLLEQLRRGEIAVVMLQRLDASNLRVPPPVMQVILQNYALAGRVEPGGDFLLVPRTRATR